MVIILTFLGSVVQSIVSLMSSLVVKIVNVLVSIISNPQIFLLKKCALTNDIISFEQLGPGFL